MQTEFNLASNWICRINERAEDVNVFITRLDDGSIDEKIIRDIVGQHENSNPQAGIKSLKKKLKVWAKLATHIHRQYYFYKARQLKDRISELDGRASWNGKNKDQILDLVVKCERKR